MAPNPKQENDIWNPGWQMEGTPVLPEPDAFAGLWAERNWRNTPGPFYGASTDTCGTGPIEAPSNVFLDPEGHEFVVVQPRNPHEVKSVVSAAISDPFAGYGADGNVHWTADLTREWWTKRSYLVEELRTVLRSSAETGRRDPAFESTVEFFIRFLEAEVEYYVRGYLFWLESGSQPGPEDLLPPLR